uniref:mucin-13 n=1 Tax=Jaculus jaculus TaxID=51337 RepID=UPI001E1B0D25|nr:mucin-13 [Jaculus jaculus]
MKAFQPLPFLALLLVNYAAASGAATASIVSTTKIPLTSKPAPSTESTSETLVEDRADEDRDIDINSAQSGNSSTITSPTSSTTTVNADTATVTSTSDNATSPPTTTTDITSTDTATVTSTSDNATSPPTTTTDITSTDTATVTSTSDNATSPPTTTTDITSTDTSSTSVSTVHSSTTMTSTVQSTSEESSTVDSLGTTILTPTSTLSQAASTTGPSDLCQVSSCGVASGASCVNLNTKHFCLCVEGYYYNSTSSTCLKGRLFPGEVTVSLNKTSDLENETSAAYQSLHDQVTSFFHRALGQLAYGQTVIVKVSMPPSRLARSEMRAAGEHVNVSVVNIFEQNTNITADIVAETIQKVPSQDFNIVGYLKKTRCAYYGCIEENGQDCPDHLQCPCKPGLQRPNPQSFFCAPQQCPETCNANFKMQCLQKDNAAPECVCQPGYQRDGNGHCQECSFGYSGMDCKDNFQLILTIVGTIAGVLVLVLLFVVISMSSRNKKKNVEEQNLIEDDFQNLKLRQTGFSNLGADGSIFPKVRTAPSRDGLAQNPYANQRRMPYPDY